MKNKILNVLVFLSLFAQTAFAQRRLSPALLPYAENWTYTLVKSMHRAGFDMPTMPAAANRANQGSSTLQLDSTRTFFEYTQGWGGDSTPIFRNTFAYPLPNTKIETNFQYDNGQWKPLHRSTIISDSQQRLVEVIAETFDTESLTFRPESRLDIFPHGTSPELVDSFFTYLWDSTILDWRMMLANRAVFDAQDRLLESMASLDNFGNPVVFKEIYSFNNNGDNDLIEEFKIVDNNLVPASRTEIMSVDHHPIEVMIWGSDDNSFFPKSRTNYAYTLFGAVRKQMHFEWNAAEDRWYLFKTNEFSYDNAQRLSLKTTTVHTLEEREATTYGYVADENLYVEMVLNWDDDLFDWVLEHKKYYYYDGFVSVDPSPNAAQPLNISPNPTVGHAGLQLDGPAFIQIYNTQGKLVYSGAYQPGQLLQLSELPCGLYFIAAQDDNKVYSGRIVKQ